MTPLRGKPPRQPRKREGARREKRKKAPGGQFRARIEPSEKAAATTVEKRRRRPALSRAGCKTV